MEDPAFIDNREITLGILESYVERGITGEDIRDAYYKNDVISAANVLGLTEDDLISLSDRMEQNTLLLKSKYDFLNDESFIKSCTSELSEENILANIDSAIENYKDGYDPFALMDSNQAGLFKAQKAAECRTKPYAACIIAGAIGCALTGFAAIITCPLAAYICICSFCEGGWVDAICD